VVGDKVVVDKHFTGVITKVNPDDTFDIEITKWRPPDITKIISEPQKDYHPIKQCFRQFPRLQNIFHIAVPVLQRIFMEEQHFGMHLGSYVRIAPGTSKLQFRLASVQAVVDNRFFPRHLFSRETCDAFCECIRRIPYVQKLAYLSEAQYTVKELFGDHQKAQQFRSWMIKTVHLERPWVTWSLSRKQIQTIERAVSQMVFDGTEVLHDVHPDRITREMTKAGSPLNPDPNSPYLLVGSAAFGEMGFIVGYSDITKLAIVVQQTESSEFSQCGGMLTRRVAVVTTLDYLVKIESVGQSPVSSRRRQRFTGFT
jgi:hypothetical protein